MKQMTFILLLMLIGFSSCSSDSEEVMSEETLTESDLFVASKEFQNYQNFMKDDAKVMRKVLKGLPKSKKEKLNELRMAALNVKTEQEYNEVMSEINGLLKFDYAARIDKIAKTSYEMFKDVDIPNSEILKASQRYNVGNVTETMTRSSEELQYQYCIDGCHNIYISDWLSCESIEYREETGEIIYEEWGKYRGCVLAAELDYDNCVANC